MSDRFTLECGWCRERHGSSYPGTRCQRCNGPLTVNVDLQPLQHTHRQRDALRQPDLPGLWAWCDFLPIANRQAMISIGEGNTPMVRSRRLAAEIGIDDLLFKDETRNPTGSFKDRMLAVGVARAVELGKDTVAVQSSGNVGASAAAYAAKAGLRAKIFVPRFAPEEKILQAQMYGADVFHIDHTSPSDIFDLLSWACGEFGWYLVSTAAIDNPFTLEGAKTIAYEIAEQTAFDLPDWIVAPVGGGGNLGSLWRGFGDLKSLGLVTRLPRMVGVQAAGCAPFVDAIRLGRTPRQALEERWPVIETIAGAIADDAVFDAHIALPAVRESDGAAVAVTDQEAMAMALRLAANEGLFVEPSSATALAAIETLVGEGRIRRQDRVVCLLTGTGLKDVRSARTLVGRVEPIPLDREAIAAQVRRQTRARA